MHILLRPEDSEPAASPGPTGIGRAQRDDQGVWLPVSLRRFLRKQSMIVTTTPSVEGKRITEMAELVEAGCVAFSQVNTPVVDTNVLMNSLRELLAKYKSDAEAAPKTAGY